MTPDESAAGAMSAHVSGAGRPFVGEVHDGTVGAWGLQLQGTVWTPSVVVVRWCDHGAPARVVCPGV
jgi:hypothetical protein